MSTEQNKKIILRLFSEGIMERNFRVFDDFIADDFVNYGMPSSQRGPGGFAGNLHQLIQAFPDLQVNIQEIIAEGNTVATRGFFHGTHLGNYQGMLSSGKKVRIDFIDFWKLRNGKCYENWGQIDWAGLEHQLGPLQFAL